jgi:hypothetical protein
VPGTGTPRTFFGLLPSLLFRTTPPTIPAAAVTTPVTMAAFGEPLPELLLGRSPPLPPRDDDDWLRVAPLRGELLLDEPLFAEPLLDDPLPDDRPPEDLLPDDAAVLRLRDALLLFFGLDPFELRFEVFLWDPERELLWAMAPP